MSTSDENKKGEIQGVEIPLIIEDEHKDLEKFRLVERTVDLDQAIEEFARELAPVLREINGLKARELARVLKAFLKMPVIPVNPNAELQSMKEHKLLIGLIKLQDTKTLLMEAMDGPGGPVEEGGENDGRVANGTTDETAAVLEQVGGGDNGEQS